MISAITSFREHLWSSFAFLIFVAFVSVSSAQDESVNARSTDTQENDSTLTLARPRASAANFASLGTPKPVEIPEPETAESLAAGFRERSAQRRAQSAEAGESSGLVRDIMKAGVRLTPEPTLGDLLKEGMRVSAAAVKDYLASLVSGSSATHSPPQSFPQPQVSDYEDRTLFRDELAGFEVAYPKTWERNPLVKGKRLAIRNSDTSKLGVISISVANAKNDLADAEKFKAYFKDQLPAVLVKGMKDRFGNGELIQSDEKVLSGHSAVLLVVSYDIQQPTGELTIVSAQLHCLRNGKIYTLNFESPANSFEDNWATFEKVMTTFNFR